MKKYVKPEMDITEFDVEDIITNSPGNRSMLDEAFDDLYNDDKPEAPGVK